MFKNSIKRSITVVALSAALLAGSASSAFAVTTIKIDGSTTVQPLAVALGAAFVKINKGYKVTVAGGGSGVGRNDARDGKVDIGAASAATNLTSYNTLKETKIARDALSIIVNSSNKVKALTTQNLRDIYSGKINNWKSFGGANAKIDVYGRAAGSGTAEYMNGTVLNNITLLSTLKTKNSNGDVKTAVKNDKNGIGYVGMAFATSQVRALTIDGVAPIRNNVTNGTYHWVRYLYLLTLKTLDPNSAAQKFINYVLSSKGQTVVNTVYVKL